MPFIDDADAGIHDSVANSYSLEPWLNAESGSDPYHSLDVPRETVLESNQSKLAKVQLWYETARSLRKGSAPNR